MADTVGSLMVEAGMNLAGFEASVSQIPAITSKHMERMSAEMKRTTREGAESLRLIDEALGVHLSRPLTRIIAQIPGVGSALQGLLGGAAFGAFAFAGVEFFDKVVKGIEKAKKAQEDFREATLKLNSAYDEFASSSYEKTQKLTEELAKIQGNTGLEKQAAAALAYADAMKSAETEANKLFDAMEKQQKASQAARGWLDQFLSGVGDAGHDLITSKASHNVEVLMYQLSAMKIRADQAFEWDKTHQTGTAMKELKEDTMMLGLALDAMREKGNQAGVELAQAGLKWAQAAELSINNQSVLAEMEREKDAAEQAKKAQEGHRLELHRGWEEANKYWEALEKLAVALANDELKLNQTAFQEIGKSFESQRKGLSPWLDDKDAQMPSGPPMRADSEELVKIQTDQNEAWKEASRIINEVETPMQKYNAQQAILNELVGQGRLTQDQYSASLKNLDEGLLKAASHAEELQKMLEKLEKNSDSAAAGIAAAFTQLELNTATGKFASSLFTTSIGGFEDETIKMLEGAKVHWDTYFKSLETMALKFAMNKAIVGVFTAGGDNSIAAKLEKAGLAATNKDGTTQTPTTLGKLLGPLFGKSAPSTHDVALGSNTAALEHLTAVMSSGQLGANANSADAAGDSGTGNFASLFSNLIPHAAGGDVMPGQGYLVGENGPEPFFPGLSGSIAPNSSLGKGGDTHIHNNYDFSDFKGDASLMNAVTAMVEKRGQQAEQRAVVQNNERSLRTTSGH